MSVATFKMPSTRWQPSSSGSARRRTTSVTTAWHVAGHSHAVQKSTSVTKCLNNPMKTLPSPLTPEQYARKVNHIKVHMPIGFHCQDHRSSTLTMIRLSRQCWRCQLRQQVWSAQRADDDASLQARLNSIGPNSVRYILDLELTRQDFQRDKDFQRSVTGAELNDKWRDDHWRFIQYWRNLCERSNTLNE